MAVAEETGGAITMIDETYEFSAPRFFDFTRAESEEDMRRAELWFDTALSYAPSRTVLLLLILFLYDLSNGVLRGQVLFYYRLKLDFLGRSRVSVQNCYSFDSASELIRLGFILN